MYIHRTPCQEKPSPDTCRRNRANTLRSLANALPLLPSGYPISLLPPDSTVGSMHLSSTWPSGEIPLHLDAGMEVSSTGASEDRSSPRVQVLPSSVSLESAWTMHTFGAVPSVPYGLREAQSGAESNGLASPSAGSKLGAFGYPAGSQAASTIWDGMSIMSPTSDSPARHSFIISPRSEASFMTSHRASADFDAAEPNSSNPGINAELSFGSYTSFNSLFSRKPRSILTVEEFERQVSMRSVSSSSLSTLATPLFALPSPLMCSTSSQKSFSRQQPRLVRPFFKRSKPPALRVRVDERPRNVSSPILVVTPDRESALSSSDTSSIRSSSAFSARSGVSNSSSYYSAVSSFSSAEPQPATQSPTYSWFKDIMVEVWIDQEGFRAIRPLFKLVGFSLPQDATYGLRERRCLDSIATVDFMPPKRQMFTFHHGALDSAPTLRRLTLNGDESRDYISRQAALVIKANGVYAVHGTESFHSAGENSTKEALGQPVKFNWVFEYMVQDRRVEGKQKVVYGEKTLTPLRFACSPGLLRPTSGKKISLMLVMKKTMAPKLTAEKVEPPKMPVPSSNERYKSDLSRHEHHWIKMNLSHTHSRHRTHPKQDQSSAAAHLAEEPSLAGKGALRMARPRAASVGELAVWQFLNQQAPSADLSLAPKSPSRRQTLDMKTIGRRIMPVAELAQFMSSSDIHESSHGEAHVVALAPPIYNYRKTKRPVDHSSV